MAVDAKQRPSAKTGRHKKGHLQPTFGRRSQMNRRTVIRLGALTALAATRGFIPPASAQSKMMFKASDVHPAAYPTVVAVENIGKKLEAATNGRLGGQMFAAIQLGGEKETLEQAPITAT